MWCRRARLVSERRHVDRDVSPTEVDDALCSARGLDCAAGRLVAEEDHRETAPRPRDECARKGQQNACAVAGSPVGRHGSAMADARESLEDAVDDRP